jgi:hypothetical protein
MGKFGIHKSVKTQLDKRIAVRKEILISKESTGLFAILTIREPKTAKNE